MNCNLFKLLACSSFLFSLLISSVYGTSIKNTVNSDEKLISLEKKQILLNSAVGIEIIHRYKKCDINTQGRVTLFVKPLGEENFQTSAEDLKLLNRLVGDIAKNNNIKDDYLYERDFTGDHMEITAKYVKDEIGIAYYGGEQIEFYSMKRRLSKTYNAEGANEFRKLIRKYCHMYL